MDDDLEAAIERALRRASLPAASEAQSGVPLQPANPPELPAIPFDDGD